MLKTRVLTAILLLVVILPSLFLMPQWGWAALMTPLAALAAWEWGAFMRQGARERLILGGATGLICLSLLIFAPEILGAGEAPNFRHSLPILSLSLLFWLLVVPFWLRGNWALGSGFVAIVVGLLVILPTWIAIVLLRSSGATLLLCVMVAVWIADIGAYFFGKLLGRHKLAPAISPGKTWEGAIGGGALVLFYGLAVRQYVGLDHFSTLTWVLVLLLVAAVSVIGDLFESMLKRQVGLKDSSNILPGHGGVMDRVDSITSVLPLVALLWIVLHGFTE